MTQLMEFPPVPRGCKKVVSETANLDQDLVFCLMTKIPAVMLCLERDVGVNPVSVTNLRVTADG